MSDHRWVLKNSAKYLAGGLSPQERERLEAHIDICKKCARSLNRYQRVDDQLLGLFSDIHPSAGFEDRVVQSCRQKINQRRFPMVLRISAVVAAILILTLAGAGMSRVIEQGEFFPSRESGKIWAGLPFRLPEIIDDSRSINLGGRKSPSNQPPEGGETPPIRYPEFSSMTPLGEKESLHEKLVDPLERRENPAGKVNINSANSIVGTFNLPPKDPQMNKFFESLLTNGAGHGTPEAKVPPLIQDSTKVSGFQYTPDSRKIPKSDVSAGTKLQLQDIDPMFFNPADFFPPKSEMVVQNQPPDPEKRQAKPKPDGNLGNPPDQGKDPQNQLPNLKIIRSGEIIFKVDSFQKSVEQIQSLVGKIKGAFVATVDSERLDNGKMRGSLVVRVPPQNLDALVKELRTTLEKNGEFLGKRIGSRDITKQYTDLESRLRAAKTMQERLLKILKEGKGEIKYLLQAETELGKWRTKIEEITGEIRYYANMVNLSTLTIHLQEREIEVAARLMVSKHIRAGIEVENVGKTMDGVEQAVNNAEGIITLSEMKEHSEGQFNGIMEFQVPREKAGPVIDRLRQLGTVARWESEDIQKTEGGEPPLKNPKREKGDTKFSISLYNLFRVTPRESVVLVVGVKDVDQVYRELRKTISEAGGRLLNTQLNSQIQQDSAYLVFDVHREAEAKFLEKIVRFGEILSRTVSRQPEGNPKTNQNFTDAKIRFQLSLAPAKSVSPRKTINFDLETENVQEKISMLSKRVEEIQGSIVSGPVLTQSADGKVTAQVTYQVPLSSASGLVDTIKLMGQIRRQEVNENMQAPAGKLGLAHIQVSLSTGELLVPKDQSLWSQVRRGLSISFRGLLMSVTFLIIAVLFLLPWLIIIYLAIWILRKIWGSDKVAAVSPSVGEEKQSS